MRLARGLGISSFAIGLTVVALGTSFPELFVSVFASMRGESAVALGNVVGSNIFNIAVILAIGAIIKPIRVEMRLVRLEIPFVLFVTMVFPVLAMNGVIGRIDSGILLLLFGAYLTYLFRTSRPANGGDGPEETHPPEGGADEAEKPTGGLWLAAAMVILGLAVMGLGARWLVETATELARAWGVSERVIGLTVLAGGTSLPELASALLAFIRRESDLAVGNLLGSNVFNTLAILGTAGMVRPLSPTDEFLGLDMLVMLLTVVLLIPLARSRWRVGRWEGLGLLAIYLAYLAIVIMEPFPF